MTCQLRWYGQKWNLKKNSNMADLWANSMACHPRATGHIAVCCHLANSMSWSHSHVSHSRVLPPREFNEMPFQSHVPGCRIGLLPLGEFTVMIIEPCATLQGAVTWRNQCHYRATLQCVRTPSANRYIKNRFSPYFIFFGFLNAVWALTSGGFRIVSDTLVIIIFSFSSHIPEGV